ncbi:hypothetical protein Cantr_10405 [Candida viswanathii]|uniref:MAU2 chromatid cohesion factor n=1 Tax=Candida viswanathii TaxID=5486 RepID=A0A367YEM8_9ASCO|nr:hypothetical protein Cantr_10405 [Candida viswanathii]
MDPHNNNNNQKRPGSRPDYSNAFNTGYQNQLLQQQELYQQQFQQLQSIQHAPHNAMPMPMSNQPTYPMHNVAQFPPVMNQQVAIQPEYELQLGLLQQQIEYRNTEYIRSVTRLARATPDTSFQDPQESSFDQTMIDDSVVDQPSTVSDATPDVSYYTLDEIKRDLMMNNARSVELRYEYHIRLSDHFIAKAHSIVSKTTHPDVMDTYYKMVKVAVKCLKVLERYNLDMHQRYVVCYKLAGLYLSETENLETSEACIKRAMGIAQSLNDIPGMFNCELLIVQLIEKTNFKTLVNYLNAKIQTYRQQGVSVLAECLELIKVRYNVVNNPETALTSVLSLVQNSTSSEIRAFCLIHSANLHLYRASAEVALKLAEQADELIEANKIESLVLPLLLTKFVAHIHLNRDCKTIIGQASKFMSREDATTLALKEGKIALAVHSPELNNTFEFKFDWLTTEEFSVVAHLLTGVALLSDSRNKTKTCFEKALRNISKIEKTHKFKNLSIEKFNEKLQRLKYFKILIAYYQTMNNFILNNYQVEPLNKFMHMTQKEITEKEYAIYKGFYPMVYYCFAMFYHHNADIQAAKYYYLKVIELQSTKSPPSIQDSFVQLLHGVPCESISPRGKFNELHLFSTFNLAILLDYESSQLKNRTPSYVTELKNKCLSDLEEAFRSDSMTNNTFNMNFALNSDILRVTHHLVLKVAMNKETDLEIKNKMESLLLKSDTRSSSAFFNILMMYLLEFKIPGDHGEKLLGYYRDKLSLDNDTEDISRLLILKVFNKHFKMIGDHDKAALSQMQYDQCTKKLSPKFEFLKSNLVAKRD